MEHKTNCHITGSFLILRTDVGAYLWWLFVTSSVPYSGRNGRFRLDVPEKEFPSCFLVLRRDGYKFYYYSIFVVFTILT